MNLGRVLHHRFKTLFWWRHHLLGNPAEFQRGARSRDPRSIRLRQRAGKQSCESGNSLASVRDGLTSARLPGSHYWNAR